MEAVLGQTCDITIGAVTQSQPAIHTLYSKVHTGATNSTGAHVRVCVSKLSSQTLLVGRTAAPLFVQSSVAKA